MKKYLKNAIILTLLLTVTLGFPRFIGNKQLRFGHHTWRSDSALGLPQHTTGNLPAAASFETGILYDSTTSTIKFSNGSSWTSLATGVSTVAGCSDVTVAGAADGHLLVYQNGTSDWRNKAVSGDATLSAAGAVAVTDLSLASEAQGDIAYRGASTWARLSAKGDAKILVGDGTDLASVSVSGDVTLVNTGATTVTDLSLASEAQGDLAYRGASVWARLSAKTDGYVLIGDGNDLASVAVSGDVAIDNTGATEVSDLTISSEAAGDILYFNGSNWMRLAKPGASNYYLEGGTTPSWSLVTAGTATAIGSPFTIEGGTNDPQTTVASQTTGAAALAIPDLANVAQDWVFTIEAATLQNKTLTSPICGTQITLDQSTADYTFTWADPASARAISIDDPGGDYKLVFDQATQTLSGKTLTAPKIANAGFIADANGLEQIIFNTTATAVNQFEITNSATANPATQLLAATGDDTNIHCLLEAKGSGKVQAKHGGGSAVEIVTLSDAQTLTSKTLTAPIIVTTGFIADGGGDELLLFTEDATPLNYIGITSGDNNVAPIVSADGADTDIDLELRPKGTGNTACGTGAATGTVESKGSYDLALQTGNATTGVLTMTDGANGDLTWTPNGSGKLILGSGAATAEISSNGTYDLKLTTNDDGTSGNIVITDGAAGNITATPNGTGQFIPVALSYTVTTKTGAATLTVAEGGIILANSNGGAFSLTLPAASGNSGLWYTVKFVDSGTNAVTIDPNAAETIDGGATNAELDAQYDYLSFVCDGSNWHITAEEWH